MGLYRLFHASPFLSTSSCAVQGRNRQETGGKVDQERAFVLKSARVRTPALWDASEAGGEGAMWSGVSTASLFMCPYSHLVHPNNGMRSVFAGVAGKGAVGWLGE